MYDTDSAQILFFGNQFRFINDTLEDFLESLGYSIKQFIDGQWALVFVHAESDYLSPSRVGDELIVNLSVQNVGETSIDFSYELNEKKTGVLVGKGKSTHVCINKQTFKKQALEPTLKNQLENYLVD